MRLEQVVARKLWKCSRCGNVIRPGDFYKVLYINRRAPQRRCLTCGFKSWEITSSPYLLQIGSLQDRLKDVVFDEDLCEQVADELEDLADELETSLWNVPDNLRYSSNASTIEERMESLQEAVEELRDIQESGDYSQANKVVQSIPLR